MAYKEGLENLLKHEGGYANDPRDNGGETYRGISRRWFPKWGGWDILDAYDDKHDLSMQDEENLGAQVHMFYYTYFWVRIRAHEIDSEPIAEMVFNMSVNMGKKVVVKKIQRVLNVKPDGVIGPITIGALNSVSEAEFMYHFLLEIIEFYVQLGEKQPYYLKGWLNRALSFYYQYEARV